MRASFFDRFRSFCLHRYQQSNWRNFNAAHRWKILSGRNRLILTVFSGASLVQTSAAINTDESLSDFEISETIKIPFYTIADDDNTGKQMKSIYLSHKAEMLEFEFIDDDAKHEGVLLAMFDGVYLHKIGFKDIASDGTLYFVIQCDEKKLFIDVSRIISITTKSFES